MHSTSQHARSGRTIPPHDASLDAFRCPRSHTRRAIDTAHSVKHASALASAAESCKMLTEAHAQRDAEMFGEQKSTTRAQGSAECEPSAGRQKQRPDERCASHGPNALRTRRNAARQVRHLPTMLGRWRGSRGHAALIHRCSSARALLTSAIAARASGSP